MEDLKTIFEENKNQIELALEKDLNEWNYEFNFDDILNILNKNEENKANEKVLVSYYKNIAIIGKITPEVLINILYKTIMLNINITFFLKNKLFTNLAIIDILSNKYTNIKYIEINKNSEFYDYQNNFEICLYIGNKSEYLNFAKRLNIISKFQNYGEIYVYSDNKDFKNEILDLEKFAYNNDLEIKYFFADVENTISSIKEIGPVDTFVIFSKNQEKIYNLTKEICAEKIYVNTNLKEKYKFDFDLQKISYNKKIILV